MSTDARSLVPTRRSCIRSRANRCPIPTPSYRSIATATRSRPRGRSPISSSATRPFIGGKDLRAELGDGYTEALWASRGKKSDSIAFVMYWWDQAATILRARNSRLRRFGFITTKSITQKFSRRILEKHLGAAREPASLTFAIPNHPWVKTGKGLTKKAQVRIAMTVAEKGTRAGKLAVVKEEKHLDTDQPLVSFHLREGIVNPDLSIGSNDHPCRIESGRRPLRPWRPANG